jgi:hypothetical protein
MIQPVKRKKVIKFMNKICKHLPIKEYRAAHKLNKIMYQDASGELWANNDEETRKPVWRVIETHQHNNKRLCLHLYDRWGIQAVDYYFKVNGLQIMGDGSVIPFVLNVESGMII